MPTYFMPVPDMRETVLRNVQQHGIFVELPGLPLAKYDGITGLSFEDVEAIGRCFSDPEYLQWFNSTRTRSFTYTDATNPRRARDSRLTGNQEPAPSC